ncbi:MAG TPA: BolA family protein [Steroidobacteraceae bacterium]|nr:BolA family protein [Steroidobacteraceae bacterium]
MTGQMGAPQTPRSPTEPSPTADRIRAALERQLAPVGLDVQDESARHAGHPGAREGGHFRVRIVSERFRGLTRIARHRLVYDCVARQLGAEAGCSTLQTAGIHALAIEAHAPEEVTT